MNSQQYREDPAEQYRDDSVERDRTLSSVRSADILTQSILRIGLAILGFVLLLYALGQAIGIDLIGEMAAFFATSTGQWLAVAFFALLLILLSVRGWRT